MPIAGRMDLRARFMRPQEADDQAGNLIDGFADAFTVWAEWKRQGYRELSAGGVAHDALGARLEIRDSTQARSIRAGWRVAVAGRTYHVVSVDPPDRPSGGITLTIEDRQGGY